jgi:APA family basic amino acid/polyamine antiporter
MLAAMASPTTSSSTDTLRPVLGLFSAAAIVVGGTIGSGVFLKPKQVAEGFVAASTSGEAANSFVPLILGLWLACGLINLCGALTLAELSTMMPHAGGNYIYLREAYGRLWAFLWGWAEFWVIRSGSTAALSAAMAIFVGGLLEMSGSPVPTRWQGAFELGFPIAVIVLLTVINIVGTTWGGGVQNLTTVIKAGFVVFLAALPFLVTGTQEITAPLRNKPLEPQTLLAAIGISLAGIMWAYDGWGMVTVVAEEIKNPSRNIPLALSGGVIFLTLIYVGANLAYHRTMPVELLSRVDNPAAALTRQIMGEFSEKLMQSMLIISVFGALNSNILVGPRVLFATARDNPFLGWLRRVDPRFGTPALAIGALSLWTCVLVAMAYVLRLAADPAREDSGWFFALLNYLPKLGPDKRLFDVLTNYTVFGGSLFYFAAVVAVFVLRWKRPDAPRPYRTWGYPAVPLVFVLFYIFLLASMLAGSPTECVGGLLFIILGMVFYRLAWWLSARSEPATGPR